MDDFDDDFDPLDVFDTPMGETLRDRMNSRYNEVLFEAIYQMEDIDGMTLWGKSGQPDWHKKMTAMRDHMKDELGPEGMEEYEVFRKRKDKSIYG